MTQKRSYEYCPERRIGLKGDHDFSFGCLLTGSPDADHRGWGYDLCNFSGRDYTECSKYNQFHAQSSPKCTEEQFFAELYPEPRWPDSQPICRN